MSSSKVASGLVHATPSTHFDTLSGRVDTPSAALQFRPHERNVDRWRQLIDRGDLPGLHRLLTGLDRDSIEMREVSPMGGLLTREQRDEVMAVAG